ncbi:MAG: c-type cytochrome [Vicinamibacterales bacterium]
MSKMFVALLMLPLLQGVASAQTIAGNIENGRMAWAGAALQCRNCHGALGQGGFAPDLAGRPLSAEQFARAVRQPWGVMPAFIDKQASDQTLADLAAYFASLPRVAELGPARFATPASAPQGQKYIVESYGCASCHQPELRDPRRVLGGEGADFETFAKAVYTHTDVYTDPIPRMGNFSRTRLPESVLREIWKFIATDLGLLAPIVANVSAGTPSGANTEYTVTVTNQGEKGKGLAAETLTVSLVLPVGATVVSNTGAGFRLSKNMPITLPAVAGRGGNPGTPAQTIMTDVAVWQVPRIAADEKPTFSVTLAGAPVPAAGFRGSTVTWLKPEVRKTNLELRDPRTPGDNDTANVALPNPGRGGAAPAAAPAPAGQRGGA